MLSMSYKEVMVSLNLNLMEATIQTCNYQDASMMTLYNFHQHLLTLIMILSMDKMKLLVSKTKTWLIMER